jgi:hypothetical protein
MAIDIINYENDREVYDKYFPSKKMHKDCMEEIKKIGEELKVLTDVAQNQARMVQNANPVTVNLHQSSLISTIAMTAAISEQLQNCISIYE